MGRDFRILAAAMSWPNLLAQLEGRAVELVSARDSADQRGQADVICSQVAITAVERDGKACVSDLPSPHSGGHDPDLVCEIAAASGRLVVGCGADARSGECHLVVADGDGLRRCFHHRRGTLARPFEWGEPIPTESEYPLNGDDDPIGLKMALRYCGFEIDAEENSEAAQAVSCQIRPLTSDDPPALGPLGRAIKGHYDWFGVNASEGLSDSEVDAAVRASEPVRELRQSRNSRKIARFYTWATACRPPLLLRGAISESATRGREGASWIPRRELS